MGKSLLPLMGMGLLMVLALTLLQLLLTGPDVHLHTRAQGPMVSGPPLPPPVVRITPAAVPSPTPQPAPAPSGATPPLALAGDVAAGKALLNRLCTACHPGGGKGVGPSLVGVDREALFNTARRGRGAMPAIGAALSDRELEDLLAYLESLKGGG